MKLFGLGFCLSRTWVVLLLLTRKMLLQLKYMSDDESHQHSHDLQDQMSKETTKYSKKIRISFETFFYLFSNSLFPNDFLRFQQITFSAVKITIFDVLFEPKFLGVD